MEASPEPSWERDIAFWTIPDTERKLLCDLWRPGNGNVSGLAIIYFHGSAWHMLDKDFLTRPFFRHLVAQGHTVMDVAYRLCPEVDIYGMIGDVKRAIAWMKANASRYGVDPKKIVLGGGSAGCHLALLAAYTPQLPELTPADIEDADLSACGVISYYGPTDLLACCEYENQQNYVDLPPVPIGDPDYTPKEDDIGRIDTLLGGHPTLKKHSGAEKPAGAGKPAVAGTPAVAIPSAALPCLPRLRQRLPQLSPPPLRTSQRVEIPTRLSFHCVFFHMSLFLSCILTFICSVTGRRLFSRSRQHQPPPLRSAFFTSPASCIAECPGGCSISPPDPPLCSVRAVPLRSLPLRTSPV